MSSKTTGIAGKSLFLLTYNIFGGIIGYVTMFFALRFVGQDAWGIFGSALGISGLLGILTSMGVDAAHIKKMTQKKNKDECMGAYLIIKGSLGLLFLIASFGGFFVMGRVFGYSFESPYLQAAVYIALLGMLLSSIGNIFRATYQAKLNAKRSILPMFVQVTVQDTLIILFSMYYALAGNTMSTGYLGVLYAYAYLLGAFSRILVYIIWKFESVLNVKRPSRALVKEYILFSIPLALMGIVGVIQGYTDRTMLQFFWNSREVGGYFTVQKLSLALIYFGSSLNFFLYPAQSKYYEQGKQHRFFQITKTSERYLSMLTAPFVFFTAIMGAEILNLFKSSLIAYTPALIILVIYAYFNVINGPYSSQMTSANRPHEVMKVGLVQATANVVLNSIFIPSSLFGVPLFGWKSTGAALATLISFLIGFTYLRYRVWKILGTSFERRNLLHIMAGIIALAVLYIIKLYVGAMYSWYMLGMAFLLFMGIYLGVLYLFKEFGSDEWKLITSMIKKF